MAFEAVLDERGAEKLLPIFESSGGKYGHISGQVDMQQMRNEAAMKEMAEQLAAKLRAGGYGGSTYELTYDPASDRLTGTYYQAVAKQKFNVYFARKGS